MKKLLGWLIIIGGVALGLWLGVWVMFIGGIVEVINGIKATPTNAIWIAVGIAKILSAWIVGWLAGLVVVAFGVALGGDI